MTGRLEGIVMSSCPRLRISVLLDKAPLWQVHGPSALKIKMAQVVR